MKKMRIIGKNKSWVRELKRIKVASTYAGHILLIGAAGCGKSSVARYIFENSKVCVDSYTVIDCAALNQETAEIVLFGACANAYSGIESDIEGLVTGCNNGTLFFDNIDALTFELQGKLLRFIEHGEFCPLGGSFLHNINVRIIASTSCISNNENLSSRLRTDLYYRFSQFKFIIPSLSQHPDDIELYLNYFIEQYSAIYSLKHPVLSHELILSLTKYTWPGNIRQLKNLCHYFVVLKFRRCIELRDLPSDLVFDNHFKVRYNHTFKLPKNGLKLALVKHNFIQQALSRSSSTMQAARLLGISRRKLDYISNKFVP